jgi:hypothetical protein
VRLRQAITLARQELRAIRVSSRVSGGRDALVARVRQQLGLGEVEARIAAFEARLAALEEDVSRRAAEIERREAMAELAAQILPVTTLVQSAQLGTSARISVVLATRNRCAMLPTAVDSVRNQEYAFWELVVVDDGSTDETPAALAKWAAEDERIIAVSQPHRGAGAARNAGLAVATGDIVCYLDDDNAMVPLWLKAVAWAFERQRGLEVLYGARVKDSEVWWKPGEDALPYLNFEPFDRTRLEAGNFVDLGVLAHRRDLPEAHFDESLTGLEDWDLLLRLTSARDPLVLPVVAMIYFTSAPDRNTTSGHQQKADPVVRAKLVAGDSRCVTRGPTGPASL